MEIEEASRFVCPDGGRLEYAVAGDGEPVVFLHGFGLDSEMWEPQWDAFSERHRVIRYDLRGYGRSSLPNGPYSHVDDLLGLIDFLRARPAHLVGLSMGGRIALRVALQAPEAEVPDPRGYGARWACVERRLVAAVAGDDGHGRARRRPRREKALA